MAKNTIIDGIAASEHLDSSGESLSIEGMDISSLGGPDSILNWEHGSKDRPAQVVGKVTFAKKIMKESDAKNKREKHFWNKTKKPFVYIKAELFDGVGHSGAQDVAAMLKYKNKDKGQDSRLVVGFSIEGGKMDKKGMVVTKSIARDVAITVKPCNKVCDAELIENDNLDDDFLYKNQDFDCEIMQKGEYLEKSITYRDIILSDIKKSLPSKESFETGVENFKNTKSFKQKEDSVKKINNLASSKIPQPKGAAPKRQFTQDTAPSKMRVGDRIAYKKPKMTTGKDIYNDPDTWKTENNMRKALIAGMMGGSPDSKTNGAALGKENIEPTLQKPFESKAQRRYAHANPDKFGGKKGIKEWEEKTSKNIPEKKKAVKKNEKLEKMSQPSMGFKQMGIENKPEMQVKTITPGKQYTKPSGESVSQLDIEEKKIANKYVQGQKEQAGAKNLDEFDKESIDYIQDQKQQIASGIKGDQLGVNITSPEAKVNEAYDYNMSNQSKEQMRETKGRGNFPSTKHHEGLHRTFSGLAEKTSPDHSKNLVRHILDNFFNKNNVKGVSDFVSTMYDKNNPHLREEHLTHILDLLTNKEKRENHNKYFLDGKVGDIDYKDLKSGWKKAVAFTKQLTPEKLNEINNFYTNKDKAKKGKKVQIQKIPPGGAK